MVLSNSSSRARNKAQTIVQCQGGGSKKAGLIPRENQPSAVSIAHLGGKPLGSQGHHKSLVQSMIMMPHQKNLTISRGIGRNPPVRFSAWNENQTSAKACALNEATAQFSNAKIALDAAQAAHVAAQIEKSNAETASIADPTDQALIAAFNAAVITLAEASATLDAANEAFVAAQAKLTAVVA
jgi:hypothetical protein